MQVMRLRQLQTALSDEHFILSISLLDPLVGDGLLDILKSTQHGAILKCVTPTPLVRIKQLEKGGSLVVL